MKNNSLLLKKLGLDKLNIINEEYYLEKELSGCGGASFRYECKESGKKVFVKILISPNNKIYEDQFLSEIDCLRLLNSQPIKVVPKLIYSHEEDNLPIRYYVTEWIEGRLLSEIIEELNNIEDINNVIHRCSSVLSYTCPFVSHRDLHPSNIIFLDEKPDWDSRLVDPKVIITDFGNAIIPIYCNYPDELNYDIYNIISNLEQRIIGSFHSLPPETFNNPFYKVLYNVGSYEAWTLGVLWYKLLTNERVIKEKSLTFYLDKIKNEKSFQLEIYEQIDEIKQLDTILKKVLKGLLSINPATRLHVSTVARIFFKYKFSSPVDNVYIEILIKNNGYHPRDDSIDDYY